MLRATQVFASLALLLLLTASDARRIRVRPAARPVVAEPAEEVVPATRAEYYAAVEPQERDDKVVLLTEGDVYGGLYGRAVEGAGAQPTYIRPLARAGLATAPAVPVRQARVKESSKEPPVQTIRNYSKVNDDGSFTFGYEAADGSFKEETRGTDCVVRGKYGYVDPDGNKREFTYVSGNPCDPNAPRDEEKESDEESGEENVPQTIPGKALVRPVSRPTTTLFQQDYNRGAAAVEREEERPRVYARPTPSRGGIPVTSTVASQKAASVVRVTPRPPTTPAPTHLPATTYRPQLLVSVTPRPNVVYTKHATVSRPTPPPVAPTASVGPLDFDAELERFQLENNVVSTPAPVASATPTAPVKAPVPVPTGQPIYTSELVFDPASGQYNTVVYQQLSKGGDDLAAKARIPQYVQPQASLEARRPLVPQSHSPALVQQQLFEQQKQNLFQQSADLYNQQRQLQAAHRFQPFSPAPVQYRPSSTVAPKAVTSPQKFQTSEQPRRIPPAEPQQFYYFAPQLASQPSEALSSGQIDAFLKGHNLQF